MPVEFDFSDRVVLVTGAAGALGSAVARAFDRTGATVCAADILDPDDEEVKLATEGVHYYQGDFTDETAVRDVVDRVVTDHGQIDHVANIAGTWRGGSPIEETDVDEFEFLFDVNLKTMFLTSKHTLPHLQASDAGTIVSVSARSSLEGGTGDGPYRAAKAGVRLLTETIAAENTGTVRANAIMPSVIDTPMNREMMPDADFASWVDPADIATVVAFLSSEASRVTSGAAVPVYGEA